MCDVFSHKSGVKEGSTTIRALRNASMICLSRVSQQLAQILPADRSYAAEYVVHAWCYVFNASEQVPRIQ